DRCPGLALASRREGAIAHCVAGGRLGAAAGRNRGTTFGVEVDRRSYGCAEGRQRRRGVSTDARTDRTGQTSKCRRQTDGGPLLRRRSLSLQRAAPSLPRHVRRLWSPPAVL